MLDVMSARRRDPNRPLLRITGCGECRNFRLNLFTAHAMNSAVKKREEMVRELSLYISFLDAFVSAEDWKLLDNLNPRVAQVWESSGLGMTSQKQPSIVFDFVNGSLLFSGYLRLC